MRGCKADNAVDTQVLTAQLSIAGGEHHILHSLRVSEEAVQHGLEQEFCLPYSPSIFKALL